MSAARRGRRATWERLFPDLFDGEINLAWGAFGVAQQDTTFARLLADYCNAGREDDPLYGLIRDRLLDLGYERHADYIMGLVRVKRSDSLLPF